jgi:uncharacterized repeat protein (TIGR01451 family)
MQGMAPTPSGHRDGRGLRLWVCVVSAVLAAAIGGAALMAATSGVEEAGATPAGQADLSLAKTDSPDPVSEDAVLTYTIEVQNAGPAAATNVAVSDDLPSQVDPQSAEASAGNCDIQGKKVSCELGTIDSGGSATVTIEVRPKKAGQITNTASVESDITDPQGANNEDTETTTVTEAPPAATCKKKAATIPGTDAGETLTGTAGSDVILAGGGDDQINAGGGKDLICAGGGNDLVRAGGGNDFAKGQGGGDRLKGQGGGDTLRGNRGRDRLRGSSGNDLLAGGKGRDSCKGGSGKDTLRSC